MKSEPKLILNSEQDLEREFTMISTQLADIKTDWNMRINALKRMQAIITSGGPSFENFISLFLKFINPLSVQLNDLRSAIVKEAAKTASIAAQTLGDSFENCAERLGDTLFRVLNSGTKIIADTGHQCLLEIIDAVTCWRLIPKTVEQYTNKNASIRIRASQYLKMMLEKYPVELFEYACSIKNGFIEMVEQGLTLAVADAAADARAFGRQAFLAYRNLYPDRANRLFIRFDSSVQRAFGDIQGAIQVSAALTSNTPKRSTSAKGPRTSLKSPVVKNKQPREPTFTEESPKLPEKIINSPKRVKSALPNGLPKLNEKKKEVVLKAEAEMSMKTMPESAFKTISDYGSTGGSANIGDLIRPPPTKERKPELEIPEKANIEDPITKFEFIIEKTYHENWSTRLNSFERLAKQFKDTDRDVYIELLSNYQDLWEKFIMAHIEHINDSNFKVSVASLESLKTTVELFPEKVSFSLEKLIPKLIACMGDNNNNVSTKGNELIELILDIYIPEDLLTLLLRYSPAEMKPRTKAKLIEFYETLARSSTDFFSSQLNAKQFITRLIALLKDNTNRQSIQQIVATIETSIEANPNTTLNAVADLPPQDLAFFRRCLQDVGSSLEADIRAFMRRSTPVENTKQEETKQNSAIKTIINQCQASGAVRYDGLKKIQKLNETNSDSSIWTDNLGSIVKACLECLNDEALSIRDCALQVLKEIFRNHSTGLADIIKECLTSLAKGFYFEERHMLQTTEEAIEELICTQNPSILIPILLEFIAKEEIPAIQAFIRQLTKAVKRCPADKLSGLMRVVINQMKESFNHSNADVRKSVVFCLVEIHYILREGFDIYLEELSPSQQKLVTIYIQRRILT
ncbi:unnamed protein product [Blepharisma stoltei]|uniref:TOG domain-containing protein n=1 Tax=Blepharisma stoltei TaxID=1481888 RepID=A0AAU9KAG3_9CILI|nr:unnamed protein product [Blepharisma stoltei]